MPTRHLTSKDLQAVYEELAPKAVANFNGSGELHSVLLMVTMADIEGKIADIDVIPAHLTQGTPSQKDAMMLLTATLLDEASPIRESMISAGFARPDVVVHLTEAWVLRGGDAAQRLTGAVSEHPARQESLLISLHTAFGTTLQMLLVDPTTRQVELTPFKDPAESGAVVEGRMQVSSWLGSGSGAQKH